MRRRDFIQLFGATGLAWPAAASAQNSDRIRRIGLPMPFRESDPIAREFVDAFVQTLRKLGWVEGKTIAYEIRYSEGIAKRLPELAADLVQSKVDVFVCYAGQAIDAVRAATSTIPIVMPVVGDAIGQGYVASLNRPGGNITGITLAATEQSSRRLQLLKELHLNLTRIAALWNWYAVGHRFQMKELETAAPLLGIELQSLWITKGDEIDGALQAAVQANAQALLVMEDPVIQSNRVFIVDFARRQQWPVIGEFMPIAADGALMSYGPDLVELWRRAAVYVDKILRGAKPADLPVELPTKYDLTINQRTAKALGIIVPNLLLVQANTVID